MEYRSPDGTVWTLEVRSPGASNAIVVFHHPRGGTSRLDRYAWYLHAGAEARDVSARLDPKRILESLTAEQKARLFRVSMPISTNITPAPGERDAGLTALEGMGGTHRRPSPGVHPTTQRMGLAGLFSQGR